MKTFDRRVGLARFYEQIGAEIAAEFGEVAFVATGGDGEPNRGEMRAAVTIKRKPGAGLDGDCFDQRVKPVRADTIKLTENAFGYWARLFVKLHAYLRTRKLPCARKWLIKR